MDTTEKAFEAHLETALLTAHPAWYRAVAPGAFRADLALVPAELLAFLSATQPRALQQLRDYYKSDEAILRNVARAIEQQGGVVPVLRRGLRDVALPRPLHLWYPRPASGLNPEHETLYRQNRFGVLRQVHYAHRVAADKGKSLDLVLTLNGLPLLTAELKNALTGQYLADAVRQYREDRNPQEPLLTPGRCLVHFAVSTEKVAMTTELRGSDTRFLPFNQDLENPVNPTGYATAYLWQDLWAPDALLDLVQHYSFWKQSTELEYDPKAGELKEKKTKALIFPRYHQRRAVERLLAALGHEGAGGRYLVKHSAGSGKSNTIAWLAHRLAGFFRTPQDGTPLFASVIVVTDRRALNNQLAKDVQAIDPTPGLVTVIDERKTSQDLRAALEAGARVVVTTLQKFPLIADVVRQQAGRNFAVLIDEAHSSQTGESARQLRRALYAPPGASEVVDPETGEVWDPADLDAAEAGAPSVDELILADMNRSGPLPHVSYFAFTATPKGKTLELFGTTGPAGDKVPFDEYTMRQAIEENFILNVLLGYTPWQRYFKLVTHEGIDAEKVYKTREAVQLLTQFVDAQETALEQKARVMLAHFEAHTEKQINGRARAMVVTRSRLHAVRYKRIFDRLMDEQHLKYRALVAFSGTVKDPETGAEYTEAGMNALKGKQSIPDALKLPQYRILIVANKYQTGFDEPLLQTMYVDKKLGNLNTVQTLSRLNRTCAGKDTTLVLDFVNEPDQVRDDFQQYYDANFMAEDRQTDPNTLFDLLADLQAPGVVTADDLAEYAALYYQPGHGMDKLQPILTRCVKRFTHELTDDERAAFRTHATDFVRLYRFLSQIVPLQDVDLAKWHMLLAHLVKKLPAKGTTLPVEVLNDVRLDAYKLVEGGPATLPLVAEPGALTGLQRGGPQGQPDPLLDSLAKIIKTLNDTYGLDLSPENKVDFEIIRDRIETDRELNYVFNAHNSVQNIQDKFNAVLDDALLDFVNTKLDLYNKLTEDKANATLKRLWFQALWQARMGGGGAARPGVS